MHSSGWLLSGGKMNLKKFFAATALTASLMTYPGCQNVLASDSSLQAPSAIEQEDERLDDLINTYSGDLIDFPLEYNVHRLVDTGEDGRLSDYVSVSDRSFIRDVLSYADHDFDLYSYGDNIYVLTNERRDAEFVGRALEILKRREPALYQDMIADSSDFDYTVFSFVEDASEFGDWASFSHAKSNQFSETGNYPRFILQDRTDVSATNQSSLPQVYKEGLSEDEIYVNLMNEKFVTMVVHESLHGEYAHNYPQVFWDDNKSYRERLEHVNIYTIHRNVADRLDSTDTYVNWLSQVVTLQREYMIDQGFSEERMNAVETYREF
jgi:hypothetical protein